MSTSLDGLGAVLPPPITHIWPLTFSARVSPVALGMLAMVMMESATGSYLNESVESAMISGGIEHAATPGVDEVADGGGGYITARGWQVSVLQYPAGGVGSELINRIDHPHRVVKSAKDVELVVEDTEATGQNGSHRTGPGRSNRADHVRDRVVTEHAVGSRRLRGCRAAYAVDVGSPRVSEHAASHVVDLVVGVGSCLGGPSVSRRIIFKWMHEVAARRVGSASAHRIKLSVGREIDANRADPDTREGRTRRPARRATG